MATNLQKSSWFSGEVTNLSHSAAAALLSEACGMPKICWPGMYWLPDGPVTGAATAILEYTSGALFSMLVRLDEVETGDSAICRYSSDCGRLRLSALSQLGAITPSS